ncbi:hypothetical protein [Jatrophihabitans fulvus]
MAEKEFHEAFWVVTGTAGPVLLVASVVAFSQTGEVMRRYVDLAGTSPRFFNGMKWRILPRLSPHAIAFVTSALPILFGAAVFAGSLDALMYKRDRLIVLFSVLSKIATVSLLLQVIGYVIALREVRRAERRITTPCGGPGDGGAGSAAPVSPPPRGETASPDSSSSPARRSRPSPTGRPAGA